MNIRVLALPLMLILWVAPATAAPAHSLNALLERNERSFDFARLKLEVDRLIDPTIDVVHELERIAAIVAEVEAMIPPGADDWTKLQTLRRYMYAPGPWNNGRPFRYDHDDPYGLNIENKLLPDYLDDRRGNCVTMPFLFVILGKRLGLDLTVALAPLHVLVKWTDERGVEHNLEATSGAGLARESHYRAHLPISDRALAAGIYLRGLADEQAAAVIAMALVEHFMQEGENVEAMAAVAVILARYPQFAYALVKKGTIAYRLLRSEFHFRYPTAQDVPRHLLRRLQYLQTINQTAFDQAIELGWQPLPQ